MSILAINDPIPVDDQGLFLRQIVDSSPALLHTARSDGSLDFFNQAWLDFVGVPLERLLGWGWTACIHPDDVEAFTQRKRDSFAEGRPFQGTSRVRRADGVYRWMLHNEVPRLDKDGTIIKWHGSSADIDDLKRAEEHQIKSVQESQRSEFYLAEAQRLGHIGSWIFDPATGFDQWSRELFQIHGLDPANGPPSSEQYLAIVHPEDRESMASLMERMISDNSGFDVTKRILRAGDEVRYVRCVGTPVPDSVTSRRIGVGIDVTDHEVLTRELKRREAYLAEAQRLSRTGTVGIEASTKRIFWSDGSARIYGYAPGTEPTPDLILNRVHPDDVDHLKGVLERAQQGESDFDFEHRLLMPDGSIKYIYNHSHSVEDKSGNEEIVGAIMDITDRKVAEDAIRRSEAYLAEAQRLSHTGSFGWKTGTEEIVWSDETYRIFEYDRTEKPCLEMLVQRLHPQDRVDFQEVIDRAIQSGTDFEHEYRLLLADGRVKHVHAIARALQNASGDREYIGAVSDITEQKMAEEKLRRSERELRTLIDAIPAFVGTAAPDGSIEFINQNFLEYTGLSREQGMGWGWETAVHSEDRDRVVATWRAGLAAGEPIEHELRCRHADGTFHWFLCRSHPLRDDAGQVLKWYLTLTNIDTLKETESALQARKHDLQAIIETIPCMVWSMSSTGEVSYANQRVLEYCGTTFEELKGNKWFSCIHPDDQEETAKEFARAIKSGTSHRIIHRVRGVDGVYRWFHTMGEPLRDREGEVIQWFGINLDIDERKRAEEALQKSERELRTLIDAIPAYVGTAQPDGSVDFVSQNFLEYTGLSREHGMGWGWESAVHPDDHDRVLASWRAALAADAPIEHEVRFRRADGTYQWFLFRGLPLHDGGGNVVKWYATITNVDTLKQTENALQTREQELVGIIETIPSMLWSTSPTGEVTHISQRVLEYSGLSFEDFVNFGWEKFIHPDDFGDTAKAFIWAIQTGEPYRATHRLRRRDGEYRWYHASGEPLRDPDGRIIQWYGLSIDIDERKRAEDHLRDTRMKLAKASRLATVAELAASIAHELNQPLMSILANAQAARKWLHAAPSNVVEVNSSIERVIRDARAADEKMQHIRALFKQKSCDKNDVEIPDILREVVRIVQEDPKKRHVPIEFHFDEPLPAVRADQIQMQQVFINLIVNAIEALEEQKVAPLVMLRVAEDSNEVLVQVIDNGPGVDDPNQIFDAFMTTKERGMGVGLAVSRTIVEAHGGRLWAENNATGGASFNVALPSGHAGSATT